MRRTDGATRRENPEAVGPLARTLGRLGVGAIAAGLLGWASPASADWPVARHDARRTAVSDGKSNIKKPATYGKTPLGGAVPSSQLYVGDVDGDGKNDVLYLAGGRLSRARPDGSIAWRTPPRGFSVLAGVADFDGDGTLDVALASTSHATIVSSATGAIEWEEPAGELGTASVFRIGDLDGDKKPDFWADACGCCAIETGSPGVRYSFAAGFGAPTQLGKLPGRSHCGAGSNTLADIDGDGVLDTILMSDVLAHAVRADGSILGTAEGLPGRSFGAACQGVNLDGKPGDEIVCFTNLVYAGAGQRGVFALGYRPQEAKPFKLLWNAEVSAADTGDALSPARVASDLDGDGAIEILVSGRQNGAYVAHVRDGATGAELAQVPGIAVGDVPSSVAGQRLLLVSRGFDLYAYTFTRSPAALALAFTLPNQRAQIRFDWDRARVSSATASLVDPDLDGDGAPDLVLASPSEPLALTGWGLAASPPKALATYQLESGIGASAIGKPVGSAGPTTFVARNDGHVGFLNASLVVENPGEDGVPPRPALYLGGYYTGGGSTSLFGRAPIAARLAPDATAASVLVVDSRGDVVALDAASGTNASPAKTLWRLGDSYGPSIRPAGQQPAQIGVFRRRHPISDPPQWVMASLDFTGKEVGSVPLTKVPTHDVIPADLAGDGSTSFVGLSVDGTLKTDLTAMSATGTQLWKVPITNVAGSMPIAAGDWNGDGADDVAAAINFPHVYDGTSGTEIATGADPIMYFMPILASLSGAAKPDMILQGGYLPARALGNDMKPLWTATEPKQPYPFGALVKCPAGPVLVEGTWSVSAQLSFTQASGAGAGQSSSIVLASGSSWANVAAAIAGGAVPGQLGDVSISENLDGTKTPIALVGSTDGHLYAIDACAGTIRWAHSFGAAVGAPILADVDGDGNDEILVSVADGYLYTLRNEALPAPSFVWDTDPPSGVVDHDVDTITTSTSLYATWGPVVGAASYEVAVVRANGAFVTSPEWIDVGAGTSATLDVPLLDGVRYFVAVRGVSAAGKSPDVTSNGVLAKVPVVLPDGGVGGAGGTGTGGAGGTGTGGAGGASTGGAGGAGAGGAGQGGATTTTTGSGGGATTTTGSGGATTTTGSGGATATTGSGGGAHAGGGSTTSTVGAATSAATSAADLGGSGCSCTTAGDARGGAGAWLAAATALGAVVARRRRRAR